MPSTTTNHRPVRPGLPRMPVPELKPSQPSSDMAQGWCRRCDLSLCLVKPPVPGFCSQYCYRQAIGQL